MYECKAVCECAGMATAGPVRQSSSLAVAQTHMLAVSLHPCTSSTAEEPELSALPPFW